MHYLNWPNTLSDKEKILAKHYYSYSIDDFSKEAIRKVWKNLSNANFFGITSKKKYGGLELNYTMQCLAMSAISKKNPSLGLSYAAHENLCINQIQRFASNNQAKNYLLPLISGETIGGLAISEENAGSDAMGMRLKATKTNNGYILNGKKMWITNAPCADTIVVYASSKELNNKNYLTAFIVDKNTKGLKIGKIPNKIGMKESLTSEIIFDNCFIKKENILGTEHNASKIMMSGLDYERLILAAGPLGIIENCLEITTSHLLNRQQFGKYLGDFQLMQAKLANMYTDYQAAKSFVFNTAKNCDLGKLSSTDCAACFLFAAEAATRAASQTIQTLGAKGYSTDYPAAQLLADAKLYEIGGGTTEIRRLLIGKNILKAGSENATSPK